VVGTLKSVATKAGGPAVAAGAAAAGVAGGLIIRSRTRHRKVLGMDLDVDLKSMAKAVGNASQRFAEASKAVSKDIERVGDQAERVGKILG
jgi:hypothetical protein